MERTELSARARRAYEAGRAKVALQAAIGAASLGVVAVALGRPWPDIALLGAFLVPLCGVLAFRGRASGRAVWPGLVAGGIAMLFPIGVAFAGHAWLGPGCMRFCLPACVVGGAIAGAGLAGVAAHQTDGESEFLLGGIAVAALAASLGCALAGGAGLFGMAMCALVTGAPVWLVAHARR
jgi:hypothetical protein